MPRKKGRVTRRKSKPYQSPKTPPPTHKRKQWAEASMVGALNEVKKGKYSINRIAYMYGVPRSTLKDRVTGRVKHGTNPGPSPYLNKEEEQKLANHLVHVAKLGYGKTRKQVSMLVEDLAKKKGVLRKNRISDGWWNKFIKRQSELSLRRADSTAHIRMDSVNKESIQHYYDLLESTLKEHNLQDSPGQIYNMDETGIPLDPRAPNIIVKRGQKKVRYRQSGKKEQISVIGCGNAAGQSIPPMVIFEGKYLNYEWTIGEVPGTTYGMSDKGWTDQELFLYWLKHFLEYANPQRPLLLLLDGHSSHFELSSIEMAQKKEVIILCLPPHTTHESQPLDSAVFGPLKKHWTQVCHDFQQANPGAVITKYSFSKLFSQAWLDSLSAHNLIAGFKNCGVHPFNRSAIEVLDDDDDDQSRVTSSNSNATITAEQQIQHSENPGPPIEFEQDLITESMRSKFEKRYEEGYDLPDPLYQKWLRITHPESVDSGTLTDAFNDTPSESINNGTLTDVFNDIPPESSDNGTLADILDIPPLSPVQIIDGSHSTLLNPSAAETISQSTISSSTTHLSGSSTRASSKQQQPAKKIHDTSNQHATLLDEILAPPKSKTSASTRAITKARVLTSKECLDIIREKEMKKRAEEEEKQKRKKEREEKRKKAQEEKERKAQEKAKKLAEKAEKTRRVEEAKAKQLEQRERRLQEKMETTKLITNTSTSGVSSLLGKRSSVSNNRSRAKITNVNGIEADSSNENQCCVCFAEYEEEDEWVQCTCKRWLHEDCIIDVIEDLNGLPRLCPYCLS